MKNLRYAGAVLLLLVAASCGKDDIITPEPGPQPGPGPVIPTDTEYYQYGLAHIDITTDGGAAVDSKDPADYRACSISVDGGGVFADYQGRGRIRGRGNSTWNWYPKKPYRIKLDESSALLGMESNKDWVLLADYRDITHMMNNVGFTMAHYLGLPYANRSRYATITLNGKDMGLYMVTEQVEEGGHRVRLDPEEGILLALDINDGPGDVPHATNNFESDVFGTDAAVKFPEDATREIRDEVREAYAELESVIDACDWEGIQRLLDVPSMIHYILIQELIANVEMDNGQSMRSGFIHRYSSETPWVMGPLWDCDGGFSYNWGDMYDQWGWGHTYFESYSTLIFGSDPFHHRGAYGAGVSDFFARLFGIPEFVAAFKARWNETKDGLLLAVLDQIDATEEIIGAAAAADLRRWNIVNYDHEEEVANLEDWLTRRFDYLDRIINAYPDHPGQAPAGPDLENAEIKETFNFEVSYAQDGHHEGTYISLTDADIRKIDKALGSPFDDLYLTLEDGSVVFVAVEPDGTLNPRNTANAPGHWFNADGYVTSYNDNSVVFSELDIWYGGFSLGKHPTLTTPGEYTISQALVHGTNAVQFTFTITITEP